MHLVAVKKSEHVICRGASPKQTGVFLDRSRGSAAQAADQPGRRGTIRVMPTLVVQREVARLDPHPSVCGGHLLGVPHLRGRRDPHGWMVLNTNREAEWRHVVGHVSLDID